VQWNAPLRSLRNGDITGYVVFASTPDGVEREYIFTTNTPEFDVVIIYGLRPSTRYSFSVLAVNTAGRGPRSAYVTEQTFAEGTYAANNCIKCCTYHS